jgi:hypothetical protein
MFNQTWYYGTIRKYIILFGTLFNDLYVNREDANGELIQTLKVPLTYAPKEKMLARLQGDPNLDRPIAMSLPAMSFEITGMSYDSDRKLNTVNKFVQAIDTAATTSQKFQYNPVPYNINLNLNIMVKNAEDGNKILEQILPYFTPEWSVTLNLVPELSIKHDIPVVLNTIDLQDVYEGAFIERKTLIWTLSFTLKGYIFGPIKKQSIIKIANTALYPVAREEDFTDAIDTLPTTAAETVKVQPGVTANNKPVGIDKNGLLTGLPASNSIPIGQISANSNYGFIIDFDKGT